MTGLTVFRPALIQNIWIRHCPGFIEFTRIYEWFEMGLQHTNENNVSELNANVSDSIRTSVGTAGECSIYVESCFL